MFVLLGNLVYGRWFLDGSDPDVRLVAVIHIYFVQLMLGGGEGGGKGSGVGFLYLTPIFGCRFFFSTDFAREPLLCILLFSNS